MFCRSRWSVPYQNCFACFGSASYGSFSSPGMDLLPGGDYAQINPASRNHPGWVTLQLGRPLPPIQLNDDAPISRRCRLELPLPICASSSAPFLESMRNRRDSDRYEHSRMFFKIFPNFEFRTHRLHRLQARRHFAPETLTFSYENKRYRTGTRVIDRHVVLLIE